MADEDDRINLLRNRGDTLDQVSQDIFAPENGDALELRPQGTSASISGSNGTSSQPGSGGILQPNAIVYVASCVAAIGGLLFGYDMGIISGAKTQLQRDLRISCGQVESVVTMLPIGGLIASLLGGYFVDKYGRKWSIIANAFLFTIGALMMAMASDFGLLLLGRFILGFAVSLSAIAECIYIAEISTPEKRGMLVSLNELGITVGILIAFLVNYIFTDVEAGWRYMFGLSAFAAVFQGIAMLFLPKTPQFLMICKQEDKAEATLRKLQLTNNVRQTMTNIRLALNEEEAHGKNKCCAFVCSPESKAANMQSRLIIGIGLVFFQQFTGQPNAIYYAADIFKQVGFCDEFSSTLATVGLGFMKVLSTGISLAVVDGFGRRKALLTGISLMALSVLSLAIFAFYQEAYDTSFSSESCHEIDDIPITDLFNQTQSHNSTHFPVCPVSNLSKGFRNFAFASLITYVCAYSFSFGPVVWILLSEIFPASSKGRAMALTTSVNWMGNVIVSGTFLQATAAFGLGGVFLFYTAMCIAAMFFVGLFVPETKNKSLEEISKDLRNKKCSTIVNENLPWRKSRPASSRSEYLRLPSAVNI